MGPSGSGKSTLINILGFIDRGYEGDYLLTVTIIKASDNRLATIRNLTVGFVFQNFKLIQNNTILENVSIPLIYNGMSSKDRKAKVLKGLEDVGLHQKEDLLPNKLSGDNNNVSRLRERLLMNLNLSLPMSQQGH